MSEELVGIVRGPLPRWGSHEVDHAMDQFDSAVGGTCTEILGDLRASPADEDIVEEGFGGCGTIGRKVDQSTTNFTSVHVSTLSSVCIFCT
ncbi:hypothetical protein [Rhodococcus sp. KRD162]|uniref:hypothetical protein n=1 Tax=Rhodococcus sp. KRD162 TaxID=2729725 RepID=UPI001F49B23B|nr:hypothetical protein [Rhodococcus sp. KRD162]